MSKWSAILKGGKYLVNNGVTRGVGGVIAHPQRTLVGAGQAVKTATIGAGVGYVGWEALVNDKPVARTVADVAIGSDNVDKVVSTTGQAANNVSDVVSDAKDAVSGVTQVTEQAHSTFSGISDFLRNMFGGNGTDMFGNFFANIAKGNVSGLSLVGLLAAGAMIFGRFGWLGKIGGALLAMMLIGNNSRMQQSQAPQLTEGNTPSTGLRR